VSSVDSNGPDRAGPSKFLGACSGVLYSPSFGYFLCPLWLKTFFVNCRSRAPSLTSNPTAKPPLSQGGRGHACRSSSLKRRCAPIALAPSEYPPRTPADATLAARGAAREINRRLTRRARRRGRRESTLVEDRSICWLLIQRRSRHYPGAAEDMRVDHRRRNITVPQ